MMERIAFCCNQTKTLLGIETKVIAISCKVNFCRNQTKTLLGIETENKTPTTLRLRAAIKLKPY